MELNTTLLSVRNLNKTFAVGQRLTGKPRAHLKAVTDVNFDLAAGETLGLVGESGCGKTTTGRLVLKLLPMDSGELVFKSNRINTLSKEALKAYRRQAQIVFQDPFSSLNPRLTIGNMLDEILRVHNLHADNRQARVEELLQIVGLEARHSYRYPHEFSGGQRQRIGVARALAVEPELIICDEPVSALDVSIRAQILNLLERLQSEYSLSYLFISHDLAVVEHIAHRVAVMYLGRIVEITASKELYHNPLHPYTKALLSAIPLPDPTMCIQRQILQGDVPSPVNPPSGCPFHPRCPVAIAKCHEAHPPTLESDSGHFCACWVVNQ